MDRLPPSHRYAPLGRTDNSNRRRHGQIRRRPAAALSPGLLREQELDLKAPLPFRTVGRGLDVIKDLRIDVHRLFADSEHLAAAAERDYPLLAAVGLPVGGDDGRARQVPAAGEIVVDEVLHQEEIDIGAIVVAGHRPDVAGQRADHPLTLNGESHDRRSETELAGSQNVVRGGGKDQRRTDAPDDLARLLW